MKVCNDKESEECGKNLYKDTRIINRSIRVQFIIIIYH